MFVTGAQANRDLWSWLQGILTGVRPVFRYDGMVEVLDNQGNRLESEAVVLATWTFERGLPAKVVGPQLNARTGEIAMEELHIAHEGLRLKLE
jgi:phage tail-like protein